MHGLRQFVDDKSVANCQQTCGSLMVKTCYLQALAASCLNNCKKPDFTGLLQQDESDSDESNALTTLCCGHLAAVSQRTERTRDSGVRSVWISVDSYWTKSKTGGSFYVSRTFLSII